MSQVEGGGIEGSQHAEGTHARAEHASELEQERRAPGPVERAASVGPIRKAALIAFNGQYVCAEGGGGRELVANRETPAAWEIFTIEAPGVHYVRNGFANYSLVTIRASNGRYVSADANQGWRLYANSDSVGARELFHMEAVDGNSEIHSGSKVALKSTNGLYVCAENGGGTQLVANAILPREWESFVLELDWMIRPCPVLFQHWEFGGVSQGLRPGMHDHPLRIGNDEVSSVRVPPGWRVVLYEHEHFNGRSLLCKEDTPFVGEDFNDETSSVRVGNMMVCSTYTDLGCNRSGSFDYRSRPDWEARLRSHVQRGLDKLAEFGLQVLRVWVIPPQFALDSLETWFMARRIAIIAEEAAQRRMYITVDLHDFAREPVESHQALRDVVLKRRFQEVVAPNSGYSNLRWSIGNAIRGPSDPVGFASWYVRQVATLENYIGPGQLISAELTPGAAAHRWQADTLGAAKRIVSNSDIVSVQFFPEEGSADVNFNSMRQWQAVSGDKFRVGGFSARKAQPNRTDKIQGWLSRFEVMGLRGVRNPMLWQFLKAEPAGHIDPYSLEFDPESEAIANDLSAQGWLRTR